MQVPRFNEWLEGLGDLVVVGRIQFHVGCKFYPRRNKCLIHLVFAYQLRHVENHKRVEDILSLEFMQIANLILQTGLTKAKLEQRHRFHDVTFSHVVLEVSVSDLKNQCFDVQVYIKHFS